MNTPKVVEHLTADIRADFLHYMRTQVNGYKMINADTQYSDDLDEILNESWRFMHNRMVDAITSMHGWRHCYEEQKKETEKSKDTIRKAFSVIADLIEPKP